MENYHAAMMWSRCYRDLAESEELLTGCGENIPIAEKENEIQKRRKRIYEQNSLIARTVGA
jgi:hypothetical protein